MNPQISFLVWGFVCLSKELEKVINNFVLDVFL